MAQPQYYTKLSLSESQKNYINIGLVTAAASFGIGAIAKYCFNQELMNPIIFGATVTLVNRALSGFNEGGLKETIKKDLLIFTGNSCGLGLTSLL